MAIDWTKNFKKYKGLWVALKKDQVTVVASGKTAKEVLEQDPTLKNYPDLQARVKDFKQKIRQLVSRRIFC